MVETGGASRGTWRVSTVLDLGRKDRQSGLSPPSLLRSAFGQKQVPLRASSCSEYVLGCPAALVCQAYLSDNQLCKPAPHGPNAASPEQASPMKKMRFPARE